MFSEFSGEHLYTLYSRLYFISLVTTLLSILALALFASAQILDWCIIARVQCFQYIPIITKE